MHTRKIERTSYYEREPWTCNGMSPSNTEIAAAAAATATMSASKSKAVSKIGWGPVRRRLEVFPPKNGC